MINILILLGHHSPESVISADYVHLNGVMLNYIPVCLISVETIVK